MCCFGFSGRLTTGGGCGGCGNGCGNMRGYGGTGCGGCGNGCGGCNNGCGCGNTGIMPATFSGEGEAYVCPQTAPWEDSCSPFVRINGLFTTCKQNYCATRNCCR